MPHPVRRALLQVRSAVPSVSNTMANFIGSQSNTPCYMKGKNDGDVSASRKTKNPNLKPYSCASIGINVSCFIAPHIALSMPSIVASHMPYVVPSSNPQQRRTSDQGTVSMNHPSNTPSLVPSIVLSVVPPMLRLMVWRRPQ